MTYDIDKLEALLVGWPHRIGDADDVRSEACRYFPAILAELRALRAVRDAAFAVHESICDYGYINQDNNLFASLSNAIDAAEELT